MEFPETIYVQQNNAVTETDNYLMCHETKDEVCNACLDDGDPGERVAIYEYVKTVKIKQRTSYVETEIATVKGGISG